MAEMIALKIPRYVCLAIALWAVTAVAGASPSATSAQAEVMTIGANADLSKGDLSSNADLKNFRTAKNVYALGPLQEMSGEIMVIDSIPFAAQISDGKISVSSTWDMQAPFLVYSTVADWQEFAIPDDVKTYADIEKYLTLLGKVQHFPESKAFPFMLRATPVTLTISVFNRPTSARWGERPLGSYQTIWQIADTPAEFVGFYSNRHQGVFLSSGHHVHTHAITLDRRKAGHVDDFELKRGGKLYLPR